MARNVGDLALLLSVLAGPDPRVPARARRPRLVVRARRSPASLAGLRVALLGRPRRRVRGRRRGRRRSSSVGRALRGRGRAGGRGPPRPRRGRRHLPHAAGLALPGRASAQLLRRAPRRVQAVARRQHPGGGVADRRRRRPRLRQRTALSERMRAFFDVVRRAGAAGLAGAAVPGRPGVPDRDQRPADGDATSTGCARRTSSPSPAARRSRCRPGTPPTGCRSASSSSRRTARDRRLLEVAAAFEGARAGLDRCPTDTGGYEFKGKPGQNLVEKGGSRPVENPAPCCAGLAVAGKISRRKCAENPSRVPASQTIEISLTHSFGGRAGSNRNEGHVRRKRQL